MHIPSFIKKLFRREHPWVESKLINEPCIYLVRDRPGSEREIFEAMAHRWIPVSKAEFSTLPIWEDYHRNLFLAARPYPRSDGDGEMVGRVRHVVEESEVRP